MFPDYSKFNIVQYSQMFKEYVNSDFSTELPFEFVLDKKWSLPNNVTTLELPNGRLQIFRSGEFAFICTDGSHTNVNYTSGRDETVYFEDIAYSSRRSKGLYYKSFTLEGIEYCSSRGNKNVSVRAPNHFNYGTKHSKNHLERTLYTSYSTSRSHAIGDIRLHEKVRRKNGTVIYSSVDIGHCPGSKEYIHLSLKKSTKHKGYIMILEKGYRTEYIVPVDFKDANLLNIFDAELMFNFDLNGAPEHYEIVQAVRKYLPHKLEELIAMGKTCPALTNALENIMEKEV